MIEWCVPNMPRWYPVSISGYHIAEAGATPVQQAAFTLSNGFTYAELLKARGADVNEFGPRLSLLPRLRPRRGIPRARSRLPPHLAIGMKEVFGAGPKAQVLKLHTQTSGRSLIAAEFQNNLTRTAIELMLAYMNYTNSCHSNSADEPFTTPTEKYATLASHGQSIIMEESGVFKHTMNLFAARRPDDPREAGREGEFWTCSARWTRFGGVLAAQEQRYQRSKIQEAATTTRNRFTPASVRSSASTNTSTTSRCRASRSRARHRPSNACRLHGSVPSSRRTRRRPRPPCRNWRTSPAAAATFSPNSSTPSKSARWVRSPRA